MPHKRGLNECHKQDDCIRCNGSVEVQSFSGKIRDEPCTSWLLFHRVASIFTTLQQLLIPAKPHSRKAAKDYDVV